MRQREDRDRSLLESGSVDAKQLADLQHELETLERRQIEPGGLAARGDGTPRGAAERPAGRESQTIDDAGDRARRRAAARDEALAEIERGRASVSRRGATAERDAGSGAWSRSTNGSAPGQVPGAGPLQGRRCGACRIEIDRGELARISAAADDDVLRCPECGAILLRVKGFGQ